VLVSSGLLWSTTAIAQSVTTAGGVPNIVPKFAGPYTLTNSALQEIGGKFGFGGSPNGLAQRLQIFDSGFWNTLWITAPGASIGMRSTMGTVPRTVHFMADSRDHINSATLYSEFFNAFTVTTFGDRVLMSVNGEGKLDVAGDVYARGVRLGPAGEVVPGPPWPRGDKGDKGDKGDTVTLPRYSVCVSRQPSSPSCSCTNGSRVITQQRVSDGATCTTSGVSNACSASSSSENRFVTPSIPATYGACCVCQ
jgi:hypothetical protein